MKFKVSGIVILTTRPCNKGPTPSKNRVLVTTTHPHHICGHVSYKLKAIFFEVYFRFRTQTLSLAKD